MSHPVSKKSALVVSAHSADLVWRTGGAIALHVLRGYQVHVVCLSLGKRGESAKLWRRDNMTEEAVKQVRREEVQVVTEILGTGVEFFDVGDYPLYADKETLFRLADVYRRIQSHFVLTYSLHDPYNYDRPLTSHLAQEAWIIVQVEGYRSGEKVVAASSVHCFEPHQPEQCSWKPDVLLDITAVWERKHQATQYVQGQEHLWEYYTCVVLQRRVQAKYSIGITAARDIVHGKVFQSIFPRVTEDLA